MFRKLLSRAVIAAGSNNRLVRAMLSRAVHRHAASVEFSDTTIDVCKDGRRIRIPVRHFPFVPELAEKFEFFYGQVEAPGGLVDASFTKVHRYADSGLEFELTSLPEEKEAIDSYTSVVRPEAGDLVFDIGAYCGVSAFHFSQAVGPQGSVVAFEPDSTNYASLLRNIERHQLRNVTPVQAAIATRSGVMKFNSEGWMGSVLNSPSSRASLDAVTSVECFTLQDACSRWGTPAYIKMDIEGEEVPVLSAAREFIAGNRIGFAVDTDHVRGFTGTAHEVQKVFESCGYQTGTIRTKHFVTTWARNG